jgi:hypothetical protein
VIFIEWCEFFGERVVRCVNACLRRVHHSQSIFALATLRLTSQSIQRPARSRFTSGRAKTGAAEFVRVLIWLTRCCDAGLLCSRIQLISHRVRRCTLESTSACSNFGRSLHNRARRHCQVGTSVSITWCQAHRIVSRYRRSPQRMVEGDALVFFDCSNHSPT